MRVMRIAIVGLACLAASGCLNWQATYARHDCNAMIEDSARRDCLAAVAQNSSEKERQ